VSIPSTPIQHDPTKHPLPLASILPILIILKKNKSTD